MNTFESYLKERFGTEITRNGAYISSQTKAVDIGDNNVLLTKQEMYVYFPARFEQAKLAFIEEYYRVVGYMAFVSGSHYGVFNLPNLLTMNPTSARTVKIDEEDYYELYFDVGVPIIESLRVPKDSTLVYLIYNELLSKPNKPCYFNYDDALLCLQKSGKYASLALEKTNVATEIVVATTTRDATEPRVMYRHAVAANPKAVPVFFGLRNIQFGVTNLPTALMGSYSDTGIDSMLVNPAKKVEKYEKLLRI